MAEVQQQVAPTNEEAVEAWNGVLFDRFSHFRDVMTEGLGKHGDVALEICPPNPGDSVLDIGCGFGDASRQLAELVGPEGSVLGLDAAERFVDAARSEAETDGVQNVRFIVADLQATTFDERFDYAFSRFGTMFFANPVAALRNVREALAPGGRLCMVVWRQKPDNPHMHRPELVVEKYLDEPDHDETDEPTCGPGPFSMAGADVTSGILVSAGFEEISLRRCDLPFRVGDDMDSAVALMMALGPAAEVIRLSGDDADQVRAEIEAGTREVMAEFELPHGVIAPMSSWIVTARAPD